METVEGMGRIPAKGPGVSPQFYPKLAEHHR